MGRFARAYDKAWQQLAETQGRDPSSDEAAVLEDTMFKEWIDAKRFDDLIAHLIDAYEMGGGLAECAVLCIALRKEQDLGRIEKLLKGLIRKRERLFWSNWAQATEGKVGAMREAARFAAAAMESHAELFHNYWALGLDAQMEAARSAMRRLQSRERA